MTYYFGASTTFSVGLGVFDRLSRGCTSALGAEIGLTGLAYLMTSLAAFLISLGGLTDFTTGLGYSLTGSGLAVFFTDTGRSGFGSGFLASVLGFSLIGLGSTLAGVALTTSALAGVTDFKGDFLGVCFLTDFGFSVLAGVGFFSD